MAASRPLIATEVKAGRLGDVSINTSPPPPVPGLEYCGRQVVGGTQPGGFGMVVKVRKGNEYRAVKNISDIIQISAEFGYYISLRIPGLVEGYEVLFPTSCTGERYAVVTQLGEDTLTNVISRGFYPRNVPQLFKHIYSISYTISELHALGIIHRDLKPDNIVFIKAMPVIIDLGIATLSGNVNIDFPYLLSGTLLFIDPDYLKDPQPVNYQIDMFSLGLIISAMIGVEIMIYKTLQEFNSALVIAVNSLGLDSRYKGILQRILDGCLYKHPRIKATDIVNLLSPLYAELILPDTRILSIEYSNLGLRKETLVKNRNAVLQGLNMILYTAINRNATHTAMIFAIDYFIRSASEKGYDVGRILELSLVCVTVAMQWFMSNVESISMTKERFIKIVNVIYNNTQGKTVSSSLFWAVNNKEQLYYALTLLVNPSSYIDADWPRLLTNHRGVDINRSFLNSPVSPTDIVYYNV